MAEKLSLNLIGNKVLECDGHISILLIDHDTSSVASLTSMLEQFLYKVINVNVASEVVSMIEKHKDIRLIIANIEMPHIDSNSFLATLLHKNIPLILTSPEINTKKTSDFLIKGVCHFLKKPISQNDIKNLCQHLLPKKSRELEKINIVKNKENIMNEDMKQMEAFRKTLKRKRISQASLLGRRSFMETFTNYKTYKQRRSVTNVEWKTKLVCPIEIENQRREGKKVESNSGRRKNLWTDERHTKFLSAISILGEKIKKPIKESNTKILKFHLGGKLDLDNHSFFGKNPIKKRNKDANVSSRQEIRSE